MVATLEPDAALARPRRRRRSRWWGLAATVLVAVLVSGGISWWYYAAHYDNPLQQGFTGGPYGADGANLAQVDTDLGTILYVRGAEGTTADLLELIHNTSTHDVDIEGIDFDLAARLRWSPYVFVEGGYASGRDLPLRAFPATVPAHGYIRLVVTFRKPNCNNPNISFGQGTDGFVTWTALGVHHESQEDLISDSGTYVPCPRYLSKGTGN